MSKAPWVRANVPVTLILSPSCQEPPDPLMVTDGRDFPADVITAALAAPVKVKLTVVSAGENVIPETSLKFPVLTVTVIVVLIVHVPVYPVKSALLTETFAPVTEFPTEFPSKQTSAEEFGTEALFAPPLEAAQFVLPVAAQVFADPPPTHQRVHGYAGSANTSNRAMRFI